MSRPVEEYAIEQERHGGRRFRHPAIGNVQLFRTSGLSALVDSQVLHQHWVTIKVQFGELADLGDGILRPSPFGARVVELSMTEAQWAHFVSSFSDGRGTACTIEYAATGAPRDIPRVPDPKGIAEDLRAMQAKSADNIDAEYDATEAEVLAAVAKYMPKKIGEQVAVAVKGMRHRHRSHTSFIRDSMAEVTERFVARAKVEVEAKAQSVIHSLGLRALAEKERPFYGQLPLPPDEPK